MAVTGSEPVSTGNLKAVVDKIRGLVSSLSSSVSSLSARGSSVEGGMGVVLYEDRQWPKSRYSAVKQVTLSQSLSSFCWLQVSVAHVEGSSSSATVAVGTTLVPAGAIKSDYRESNGGTYAFTLVPGVGPDDAIFLYGSGNTLNIDDDSGRKSIVRVVGFD